MTKCLTNTYVDVFWPETIGQDLLLLKFILYRKKSVSIIYAYLG